jgi:phenylpropionate dioxygenase-like ring-hydroxylating dioxygenase large terminal subunit
LNPLTQRPPTYRDAQRDFRRPDEPLRRFAKAKVVCEGWYFVGRATAWAPGVVRRVSIGPCDVVMYRDWSGTMRAVERACGHMGADLVLGRVVEAGLQCAFHRWCWGPDGSCAAGGGVSERRRIRTYAVREKWGIVWIWAGGAPLYELPDPAPVHARRVLRLPPQRLNCHPHVILGNGLDFAHVPSVHRFRMLEDPAVELDPPHRLTVGISGRFGSTWMRRLLRLAGRTARWRFTTIGPSLAWLTVESPTRFELLWAARPLPDGTSETRTVLFLASRRSLARALPMMIATTWADKRTLQGLRFRDGFVPSDAVFCLYARLIEELPEWTPDPI